MDTQLSGMNLFDEIIAPERHLGKGEALFTQGAETIGIFELVKGRIRLSRVTLSGYEVTMHMVQPGEFFAEASLFLHEYHCDAIAVLNSTVKIYKKAILAERFKQDAQAMWFFAEGLAHQVQGLRTRLTIRQIRSAKERILQTLQLRANKAGFCKLIGTSKHFAEELGLTHEALYRALADLESSGAIQRNTDGIMLIQKS